LAVSPELQAALQAAGAAGELLKNGFRGEFEVVYKGDIDPVTALDHQSEDLVFGILKEAFPAYAFLGEEDHHALESGRPVWIVDPLDGTSNFSRGYPFFSVSIALHREGETVLGVVYSPLHDDLFVAQKGIGAWLNGAPIRVSSTRELGRALIASGFPYDVWTARRDNLAEWSYFTKRVFSPRCDGCASLDLCYVARGTYDAYWELDLAPWDMAAGALVVAEAGGLLSGTSGEPFDPFGSSVLAATPYLHGQILEQLLIAGQEDRDSDSYTS
jgi:myo-inositol-1(or 4)-monophosphatase